MRHAIHVLCLVSQGYAAAPVPQSSTSISRRRDMGQSGGEMTQARSGDIFLPHLPNPFG